MIRLVLDCKGGQMLQIKNLTITHRKDLRVILEDFNMVLNDGDKAVVIGEEGDGKSTLLKWIYDPVLAEGYTECTGTRIASGERLGYLPQELPAEEREKTVYQFFCGEMSFYEQTPKELALLARTFQVEGDFFYREQRMDSLSGGEKIKVQLMRLMMCEPTVLLLDEPSNDLDLETLSWLEQFICGFHHIVLFISHDETLIENTANTVIHIEQVQRKTKCRYTVARMPYQTYITKRRDSFQKQEQQAADDRRQKKIRDEKYKRIYQSVDYAQETITRQNPSKGRLLKKKMHAVKSLEKRFAREDENMTEMPEQEEAIFFKLGGEESIVPAGKVVLEYACDSLFAAQGQQVLARDIFLRVKGPEKICITGANGCGKTTLLKNIADEISAKNKIKAEYMPQNYEELLDLALTPVEYLAASGEKEERTRIRTYLGSLKYTANEMEHPIAELSGGQKAKIFLLKMSLSGAQLLILDEPTRNFSPLSGPVIRRMLREFPGAIISISHDRKYIDEVCDKVYRFSDQRLMTQ